ncbi:MAG: adenylate kinase, partial [Acidiferrobacteraceae bacterium]|nr:adenylate kinase [Acidiferrobacteraceae bacterium]
MRIVLLGAPGSGKGTQAKLISGNYRVPHISTGEILRAAVAEKSMLGKKIAGVLKAGDLVSDDIVIDAVVEKLRRPESRRGFVLDGFPRNIPQAQELDTRLGWVTRPLQLALHLSIDQSLLLKRITGRLVCEDCGAVYNKHFFRTKKRGICDECDSRNLGQRSDDNEEAVRRRLEAYFNETEPLIAYYRAQHKLRTVPADTKKTEIFHFLCEVVDLEIRPLEKKVVPNEPRRIIQDKTVPTVGGRNTKTSEGTVRKRTSPESTKKSKKKATQKKTSRAQVAKKKATQKKSKKKATQK